MQKIAKMQIKAGTNASLRTKNRIKEHGPTFVTEDGPKSCSALNGVEAVLLKSTSTGWVGWISVHEFDLTDP